MLVLSRKTGEQIVVPEYGVSVTVVAVKGRTIRLGITAPAGVPIFRSELVAPRDARAVPTSRAGDLGGST